MRFYSFNESQISIIKTRLLTESIEEVYKMHRKFQTFCRGFGLKFFSRQLNVSYANISVPHPFSGVQ